MLSLIYTSTATGTFDDGDLATLLMNSRSTNRRLDLTGLLLFKDGRFLQVLEGPEEQVRDRVRIITNDPRHTDFAVLLEEKSEERRFPSWTMGYEPVTDVLADEIPGYQAAFSQTGNGSPAPDIEPAVRQLVRWFQAKAPRAA